MNRTIIFHIPHDGNQLEESLMPSVIVDREQFLWYHDKNRGFDYADFTVICEDIVTDAVPQEKKKKKK